MILDPQLDPRPSRRHRVQRWLDANRWASASIVLHLALLAFLIHTRALWVAPIQLPGDKNGHHILLTYAPGHSSSASALDSHPAPKQPTAKAAIQAPAVPKPAAPATANSAAATSALNGTTSDALGSGNVTVAQVVTHPAPRPDLTQLPSGTRGDVIIDVVIDATGHIVKTTMASGLGHGVDDTVLATIQQWTFQPATRNGIPVPSEQELLFHYERG